MINKINLICFLYLLFLTTGCQKQEESTLKIEIITESLETKDGKVTVKCQVNAPKCEITEHGHCWSENVDEAFLEPEASTCLGPLPYQSEFVDQFKLEKGRFYVRAYVIANEYIYFGETHYVQIQ